MFDSLYSVKALPSTSTAAHCMQVTDIATLDQTVVVTGNVPFPELAAVMILSGESESTITFRGVRYGEKFYSAGLRLV